MLVKYFIKVLSNLRLPCPVRVYLSHGRAQKRPFIGRFVLYLHWRKHPLVLRNTLRFHTWALSSSMLIVLHITSDTSGLWWFLFQICIFLLITEDTFWSYYSKYMVILCSVEMLRGVNSHWLLLHWLYKPTDGIAAELTVFWIGRGVWWLESSSSRDTACSTPTTWSLRWTCIHSGMRLFGWCQKVVWHISGSCLPCTFGIFSYYLVEYLPRLILTWFCSLGGSLVACFLQEPHCSAFT